jgi:hypothetical protein
VDEEEEDDDTSPSAKNIEIDALSGSILKGEVSLYCSPPVKTGLD